MKKKALNKDIKKSINHSLGRFISIMLLMALGSFALVGLSISGPDMRETGITYFNKYNTADITITSDYGIDETEIKQIEKAKDVKTLEYIYLKDVTVKDKNTSFRIFSKPKDTSMYEIVSGKLPIKDDEIAIDSTNEDNYKIGDTIEFIEKEGTDGTKTLKNNKFKITGFIKSSEILSTLNRGQTTVGTGSLDCYGVVNSNVFDSSVYMMAKITFNDTYNLDPYSDSYNEKIISHKRELEELLDNAKNVRFNLIKSEYQDKINDATITLNNAKDELNNAKISLNNASIKINNAKYEINVNENKLNSASKELEDADALLKSKKQELNSKKLELANSKKQLEEAQEKINSAEVKLTSAKTNIDNAEQLLSKKEQELNNSQEELSKNEKELANKKQELLSSNDKLESAKKSYEDGIKTLEENINNLNLLLQNPNLSEQEKIIYNKELNNLNATLESTKQEYNLFLENTYNPNIQEIENGLNQIKEKESELNNAKGLLESANLELNSSKQELNIKKQEYEKSYQEFETSKNEYNKNINIYNNALAQIKDADANILVAESELNSKKTEYNDGVKSLESAKKELEIKEKEYYEKLEEYNNKLPDANKEISDGESKIEEAQEKLDSLESPVYEVYNRRETPGGEGYGIYETVSNIIDSLSDIFPWFMYFVAALVTLTTMTRFVDEERINMGTLTSLGYKDKDITKKFVVYGFLAATIGTIIGVLAGHTILPFIVYNAYSHGFTVPTIEIHFYLKETICAFLLSFICSVLPAYIVAKKNLKEKPADLLLPKAPASGSKILLERIKPIWKKLNFTNKVTARNIFRYKKRMLMTIFGVAGASAILFTGFSVQHSISTINDKQFKNIIKYNSIVAMNDNLNDEEIKEFNDLLNSNEIKDKTSVYYEAVSKETGRKNDKQEIKLIIPKDTDTFKDYIDLHTRKSNKHINIKDDGVVISERLATSMNVKVGDTFTFEDSKGNTHKVKVSGICEMYAGHFIFMNSNLYETIYNETYHTNAYMLLLKDTSTDNTQNISAEFMKLSATKGVVQNTTMYNMVDTIVKSLNKIMIVLIILASLLAIVILFNLTNINVAERIRELSTIKVLGFRDKEVTMYIYRETIILSQIGIIFGWLFGMLLHNYILTVVPPDEVMFNPSVWLGAYIISFVVINIVTYALKYYINKKLINVDMIEALKSVD